LKERSLNPTAKNSKTFSAAAVVGISVADLLQKERKKEKKERVREEGEEGKTSTALNPLLKIIQETRIP
jgi:hypothetical protein